MREFFRGWRRKAGLVTLTMACVLTVAWMRSYVIHDAVLIPAQGGHAGIESHGGSLTWFRWSDSKPSLSIEWISQDAAIESDPWDQFDIEWRFDLLGVICGVGTVKHAPSDKLAFCMTPYWSLVLPLTLLSAWLILIKPWPAKSAKESNRG